jgi:hypothetical protein
MGNKYDRKVWDKYEDKSATIDVYRVLEAFDVRCPATADAIKKLLCLGRNGSAEKGHNDEERDLAEAAQSIEEARAMVKQKRRAGRTQPEAAPEPQVQPLPHKFAIGDEVVCLNTGWYSLVENLQMNQCVRSGELGIVKQVRDHYLAVQFNDPGRLVLVRIAHVNKLVSGGAANGQ